MLDFAFGFELADFLYGLVKLAVEHDFVALEAVVVFFADQGYGVSFAHFEFEGVGFDDLQPAEADGDDDEAFDEDVFDARLGLEVVVEHFGEAVELFLCFVGLFAG